MMKHFREILDYAKSLAPVGAVAEWENPRGRGHPRLILKFGGRSKKIFMATTPRNMGTCMAAAKADVRKAWRDLTSPVVIPDPLAEAATIPTWDAKPPEWLKWNYDEQVVPVIIEVRETEPKTEEMTMTTAGEELEMSTNTNSHKKKIHRKTDLETLAMGDLLREVGRKGDDGYAEYKEGWDDLRVARKINPQFTAAHASTLRRDMFGPLRPPRIASNLTLETRIKELEDRVAKLEREWLS